MKTGNDGINLIKKWESLQLTAYLCPAGVPTIGYGHIKGVNLGDHITEDQANRFLIEDLQIAECYVCKLVSVELAQTQFDALVSFVYNLGYNNFASSTLLKKVNANPNDSSISCEFKRWIYAGGKVLNGLISRRDEESVLYFKTIKHVG